MKVKKIAFVLAAVCLIGTAAMAADEGIRTELDGWGTVLVPTNMYIEKGTQNTLAAASKGYDMTRLVEDIYPVYPRPYQIIIKDDAHFQYGYMLRYSLSVWDLQQLFRGSQHSGILNVSQERPTIDTFVKKVNSLFQENPPAGFRLIHEINPVKRKGNTFYEGMAGYNATVNDMPFTELLRLIAWQHGSVVEIAVIMGSREDEDGLLDTVTGMLETAKDMPDY